MLSEMHLRSKSTPDEMVDCSEIPRLTKYLVSLRYSDDVIKKVLGGNSLRLLREGWKT